MIYPSIDRFNILNVQQFSSCKMVQVKFSGCYGKPIN